MAFTIISVFLAFVLNRFSVRFFSTCRCLLDFTPFSASILFGLSLITILVKHTKYYPCWIIRVNKQIIFLYELFLSMIIIEVGFCLWNFLETLIFFKIPAFLEENCIAYGDFYINAVESPIGVSIISNLLSLFLLLITLHVTRVCNFSLLIKTHGIHKFFADAGLTTRLCKHHKSLKQHGSDSNLNFKSISNDISSNFSYGRMQSTQCSQGPKMLRSGKKIY